MTRHLTLGTAGHVDHGKTTLVRALTGVDTDRLEEERRRGISIVLGYAELALNDDLRLSVVDVPGHERFVRTMVGGATGIDLAMICVAADDGVMPQTVEHLAILSLLGVEHAVVALTKADLVDDARRSTAEAGIRAALAGTPFPDAAIIPVSAPTGSGLDALVATIAAAAAQTPSRDDAGRVRLPVDRTFALHGIGTVVTGTLWSGTLAVGETVTIEPSGRQARVRSLQIHGADAERAGAGSRVAVALVGVERDEVPPGSVLWT
ncbi:MAG: selenocysteine-specific translation elongation factor, partial [Gaiellales bacterium]|nr:selenocysteine-specific translation elongation factor [Gaiellales bacterium]